MNRKRLLTVLGLCVALVVLVGIGIALVTVWPMISSDQVVVGPPPDEAEFAEAPVSSMVTLSEPVANAASELDRAAGEAAGLPASELLVGEWQTFQSNEQQQEGAYFVFYAPEHGTVGELWYCPDPALSDSYEGWIAAEWELGDDGVLIISPITVGFVSSEYEIEIRTEEQDGQVYRTLYMSSAGGQDVGTAGLVKVVPPDPAWDEYRPEPYDPETFTEASGEQVALAEEITGVFYPLFEVETVLVEVGDPQDESETYMGDALHVALRLPGTSALIAETYYTASADGPEPAWLDQDDVPEDHEAGEADDGTPYLVSHGPLGAFQGEDPDQALTLLLEYVAYYYPDSVVAWAEVDGESAFVNVTRWDAYLTQEGVFALEWLYHADEDRWELKSSGPALG